MSDGPLRDEEDVDLRDENQKIKINLNRISEMSIEKKFKKNANLNKSLNDFDPNGYSTIRDNKFFN